MLEMGIRWQNGVTGAGLTKCQNPRHHEGEEAMSHWAHRLDCLIKMKEVSTTTTVVER